MALAGLLAPASQSVDAAALVPPRTPVTLQFMQNVSTKSARRGDRIALRVYDPVVDHGKTLIRKDAPALGVVTSVKRPGIFGKKGELKIRLDRVSDVHGHRVPLETYRSGDRFRALGPGASGAGLLILGPLGLVGGAFVKGKDVTISAGTRIQAEVAGG
jgi:hypothetical protein